MTVALSFLNPALLYAGTALASVPIIIHLLNRLRFRRVVWAAMEFLIAAHRKNARRIRIEHIILLIIRTLIILLLAAAVARPVVTGLLAGLGTSAAHHVLVIDDSYSMGARYGVSNDTLMKEARNTALSLVEDFQEGDGVSLVLAGSSPHVRIGAPSFNHEQVAEQVEKLRASDAATDMPGAFHAVKKILAESDQEQKFVYVLTDNTARAWQADGKDLQSLVKTVGEQAGVVVVDLGRTSRPNLAIRTLEPETPAVTTGVRARMRIAVENLGSKPVENVVVRLTVDRQGISPVTIGRIAAGETEIRTFGHPFRQAGGHVVVAELKDRPEDAVAADSRRFLALDVKRGLRLLAVDGEPGSGGSLPETFFLRLAMDPRLEATERRETVFLVDTIRDTELGEAQLADADLVVLANVALLGDAQVAALERFVRGGGSLMVFPGDQVRPDAYNRTLYAEGEGLLPAALEEPVGDAEKKSAEDAVTIDARHFNHPALAAFKEAGAGAGFSAVQVFRYFRLQRPETMSAPDEVLRFSDGRPALLEKSYGRGRVMLWAITADDEWTYFPRLPAYPELLHELVEYMAPNVAWRYNCLVGSETTIPVGPEERESPVLLTGPDQETVELTPRQLGDDPNHYAVAVERLNESGIYTLESPGQGRRQLAVNVDPEEADLRHLDRDELQKALGGAELAYAEGRDGLATALAQQNAAGGWARNLLSIALVLLLAETALAWWFNRQ